MSKLTERASSLLREGVVSKIIGYREGSAGKPRPFFCEQAEQAAELIFDSRCANNLAVYLTKSELLGEGKAGIVATVPTLKTIVRLAGEHQLDEQRLLVLTVNADGDVKEFASFAEIDGYLAEVQQEKNEKTQQLLERIEAMSPQERWAFWQKELSKCFKCYACRAACPLCYCTRCIVEVNAPQWIQPWAATLPNMEWQINRAMHLAGRCTGCGACADACPVGIPIHLLTKKIGDDIRREFGESAGASVLSTFKPEDKEDFIR